MPTPFKTEDLFLHRKITGLHCAPGWPVAVCSVRSVNRDQDSYHSCLWTFPLDGGEPRQLTFGAAQDNSPRWSPDGHQLAFVSNRGGSLQVHLMPRDGGEARACSRIEGGVSTFRWAPDGRSLLVAAMVAVDPDRHGVRGGPAPQRAANAP